jgi:hypothetical protein
VSIKKTLLSFLDPIIMSCTSPTLITTSDTSKTEIFNPYELALKVHTATTGYGEIELPRRQKLRVSYVRLLKKMSCMT